MKKYVLVSIILCFLGVNSMVFAQGEMDAYKFSQYDLNGTARYLGMGGAFGAVGGDISAMGSNPAGLGIYRSSEVVTTLGFSSIQAKTDWSGTKMSEGRTRFNFDNIAYVGYFPTGNYEGLMSWNIGFAYNRMKNFNRRYRMGHGRGGFSLSDYIAEVTNRSGATGNELAITNVNDPYKSQNWLSVMGYETYMIDTDVPSRGKNFYSSFGQTINGVFTPWDVQEADLFVSESGAIDKYDFSLATNISNLFFVGATLSITDLNYNMATAYTENFGSAEGASRDDILFLDNYSRVDGTGYSFNLGVIARPVDFLRLGIAFDSPTWYKMTNTYGAEAGARIYGFWTDGTDLDASTTTPDGAFTEYKMRSPYRMIFSAAAFMGKMAMVSVDYEMTNYKGMKLYTYDGYETVDNDYIREDFGMGSMLKIGAEIKPTPQLSVRVGGALQRTPVKNTLIYDKGDLLTEVSTAGTNTSYTIDRNVNYLTVGLGYRFTPNFYTDLACVYRMQKEDVYPFSSLYLDDVTIESVPAALKTNTMKVALTLGYKF